MKAYEAWTLSDCEGHLTVVFADNIKEAKKIAFYTETCEDSAWTDIRVRRFPEMDEHYRGLNEIDWYNDEDRCALVSLGWSCIEPCDWECEHCPAKDICYRMEDA